MRLLLRSSAPSGSRDREAQPSAMRSIGESEEKSNPNPDTLDLAPFTPSGEAANSFFDVFFEITVESPGGTLALHNEARK